MQNNIFKKTIFAMLFTYGTAIADHHVSFSQDSNTQSTEDRLEAVKKEKAILVLKLERELADNTIKTQELGKEITDLKKQLNIADVELDLINASLVEVEIGTRECIKEKNIELARVKQEKKGFLIKMPKQVIRIENQYQNNLIELNDDYSKCLNEHSSEIATLISLE